MILRKLRPAMRKAHRRGGPFSLNRGINSHLSAQVQRQPDRQRDHQHRECIAAELVRLIDDALHGATHEIDAKGLEAHEDLNHLVKLQRGIVGKLMDPGAGLGTTGERPHHRFELHIEAFSLVADLEHGEQLRGQSLNAEPGTSATRRPVRLPMAP